MQGQGKSTASLTGRKPISMRANPSTTYMRLSFDVPARIFSAGLLVFALSAAGCGSGEQTHAVLMIRGQVLVDGQPADGAIIKLIDLTKIKAADSLPKGTVADAQGRFAIGEQSSPESSVLTPGAYALLVAWMKTPDTGGLAEDRLNERYLAPENPALRIELKSESIELGAIRLTTR
jgi:hypothetical protein